ncbi:MAG: hypothetical protein EXQ60_08120, partial [Candidatus Nanopelagicales bacterium]|nr:hypothetical protein [Candidatus Nanopelagicales bacterium]
GGDGKRSTGATGRAIFADCVRRVDSTLADRIEHTRDWRAGYLTPIRDIVAAATATPNAALQISRDGLASAHRRFRFGRDGQELNLGEAMASFASPGFCSVHIQGVAQLESDLSLPYHGRRLFGRHLRDQVDKWVADGIAEPSFAEAIHLVLDNPNWLDLRGVDIALLGAGAEMGPIRSLLRWGATVHAVDLQRPAIWQRLIDIARSTAGSLRIPIEFDADGNPPLVVDGLVHPEDDVAIANVAGANLLTRAPEVRTWLAEIEQPFVLGTYAYADGSIHVLLSVAADAVVADLLSSRDDLTLAYLATPTDTFMVPLDAVLESRRRWDSRGLSGLLQAPLRTLKQFEPNYPQTLFAADGTEVGLNDSLISQQGANYALAKRLQRWRALAARSTGTPVSINLAPATRTQSVVKNRALAAAYAGADRFGIEVFEPATSTALMAALLVHDLRNPAATANPATQLSNPMELFVQGANHGGLWRAAYSPRSILGIAALLGMFESRA